MLEKGLDQFKFPSLKKIHYVPSIGGVQMAANQLHAVRGFF